MRHLNRVTLLVQVALGTAQAELGVVKGQTPQALQVITIRLYLQAVAAYRMVFWLSQLA